MIDAGTDTEAEEFDAAELTDNAVVDGFAEEIALDDAVVEGGVTVGPPIEDD